MRGEERLHIGFTGSFAHQTDAADFAFERTKVGAALGEFIVGMRLPRGFRDVRLQNQSWSQIRNRSFSVWRSTAVKTPTVFTTKLSSTVAI